MAKCINLFFLMFNLYYVFCKGTSHEKLTFEDANNRCKSGISGLDVDQRADTMSILVQQDQDVWVITGDLNGDPNSRWYDELILNIDDIHLFFCPLQPNDNIHERCILYDVDLRCMKGAVCSEKHHFVCIKPQRQKLPDIYDQYAIPAVIDLEWLKEMGIKINPNAKKPVMGGSGTGSILAKNSPDDYPDDSPDDYQRIILM